MRSEMLRVTPGDGVGTRIQSTHTPCDRPGARSVGSPMTGSISFLWRQSPLSRSWPGRPGTDSTGLSRPCPRAVSYTHLRAHETGRNLVCRLLLEKKKKKK